MAEDITPAMVEDFLATHAIPLTAWQRRFFATFIRPHKPIAMASLGRGNGRAYVDKLTILAAVVFHKQHVHVVGRDGFLWCVNPTGIGYPLWECVK